MKTQTLSVDLPLVDGDTQSRLAIHQETVDEYAGLIKSNGDWPFPPIDVFHDGTYYYVADGFHRFLAAQRSKLGSCPCRIHKGTAKDARIFGMTANDKHGLRMNHADKRACVGWLLNHGGKMTQKEIADTAGVSVRTVKTVVADRKGDSLAGKASPPKREGKGQIAPSTPSRGGAKPNFGKCPVCAGTKWDKADDGVSCRKCDHPHGEPAGDLDEGRLTTQRQKTVKTVDALMRAFDDLQTMRARSEHSAAIESCKHRLKIARAWK